MTEHLPECPVEKRLRAGRTVGSQTCICDALRSCAVRVMDAAVQRVEAIVNDRTSGAAWLLRNQVIPAIKGELP